MPAQRRLAYNVVARNLHEKTPYARVKSTSPPPHVQATVAVLIDIWGRNTSDLTLFTHEVLRRCQFSRQLLETALYYLVKLKPHVEDTTSDALKCPKKMLLAALILSGKYMQDRPYSMAAWSKISGLAPSSLAKNELIILESLNWEMYIPHHGLESLHLHLQTLAKQEASILPAINVRLPEVVPELTDDDSS